MLAQIFAFGTTLDYLNNIPDLALRELILLQTRLELLVEVSFAELILTCAVVVCVQFQQGLHTLLLEIVLSLPVRNAIYLGQVALFRYLAIYRVLQFVWLDICLHHLGMAPFFGGHAP